MFKIKLSFFHFLKLKIMKKLS